MAKMIPLIPAPSVALPAEGWTFIATEAGRYGDGLRASIHVHNGEPQHCGQVRLAQPKTWKPFIEEVTSRIPCDALALEALLRQLTETIEVMLRPKPRPQSAARAPTERPQIQVNARFDREIIADALNVLTAANAPPTLFVRGTEFVRVAPDRREAERFDVPRVRSLVDELADCVTITHTEEGEAIRPARLPFTVCQDLLVKPLAQTFPPLTGIRTAPVFLHDGQLLRCDGYDPTSGYLLRLGDLRDLSTDMPLKEARDWLQDELLGDFPLVEAYSQAHALTFLLEPFVQPLILDKRPIYGIDASTRGAGKGLLADVACLIHTGEPAHVMALTGDTAEDEKRITALLVGGASWVLLDNVTHIDSDPLSAALTASIWRGRILGVSRMASVPNDATWVFTGNNVRLSTEVARRVIPIRLEPEQERPEERTGFRHDPLLTWTREHRGTLVSACLSLIRAWWDAGQPTGTTRLGSFERWARIMGGILNHAGVEGFLEGREALHADADTETADWKAVCEHWWTAHEEHPITAKDVLALAKQHDLLLWLWSGRKEIAAQQRLGHALNGLRGRVLGRYCLRSAGRDSATKNAAYRLELKGGPNRRKNPRHENPDIATGAEGDTQTPETPQTVESRESSQSKTPPQNTRNTPSARGVLGRGGGVSQKTPAVDGTKTADNSGGSGVSGVLGCFDGPPAPHSEQPGERSHDREEVEL